MAARRRPGPALDAFRAAARLSALLGDHGAIIGGLAVSAWGFVRATEDVDFVSDLAPSALVRQLASAGVRTELKRGDILEGDIPWVVEGEIDGFPFQIMPPLAPVEWSRARVVPLVQGGALRVVDLDTLLRLKLRAGGPKDLMDVSELLALHPDRLPGARNAAEAYGVSSLLETWIKGRRPRRRR